ncbi:MAG: c-type cytochrome, partial [Opitutaceae bacterium]
SHPSKLLKRFAVLATALLLAGCPNMDRQSNFRPFEPAPHFPDGTSARPIPRFTIARDAAIGDSPALTGRLDGQPVEAVPVAVTRELILRGRERFNIYCAVCHGPDGHGDGIVVRRGFPAPTSFHEDRLRTAPAGHFFEVITYGYGVMYSYADRVSIEDRWAITAYIRALQHTQPPPVETAAAPNPSQTKSRNHVTYATESRLSKSPAETGPAFEEEADGS